ncbi:MAG: protein kinase, partial [Acidobacteriota bacterium]
MIGKTLGHYEILAPLGTGGMGEVYRARDTKLDREVALKVLPAEMAADEERLERFRREALSVAALNHPNIVTIHSVEQDGDTHFITLEYVDGKTLDAVVGSGGLPIDRFFDIAIPLTDAVAAAHERGIAHRDLKPSNVMVSSEGRVKVLDFGLAKLLEEPAEADAKTELATHQHLTEEGKVLGTVAYMSPEQAEGKPVDHRSDVFSLGILLYEMATGDRPFKGDTKLSVLSSIVRDEPTSITELNVRLPRHLGRIVKKALEKKPTRRYQTVLDVRNDLDELKHEMESGELLVTGAFMRDADGLRRSGRSTAANLGMGAAGIVAVLAVAWAAWLTFGAAGGDGAGADAAPTMNLTPLTAAAAPDVGATISPDGEWVAFSRWGKGNDADIYLQSIGSRNALQITHDVEAYSPAFSPDGTQIAFSNFGVDGEGAIYVMGRTGDRLRQLTERGYNPAWSPDGTKIAFGDEFTWTRPYLRNALWPAIGIVDVESGEITELPVPDAVQPAWSPDGERIAYWGVIGGNRDIWTVSAAGGEPLRVTDDAAHDYSPVWSPDGRWLYFASDRGGSMAIWRVGIDQSTGVTTGEPRQMTTGGSSEPGLMSISADGKRMAYTETIVHSTLWSAPFDPEALAVGEQREPLLQGARRLLDLSIAANGNGDWVIYRNEGPRQDVYVASTD